MSQKLNEAIAYAAEMHVHQMDWHGKPYIMHCMEVMQKVDEKIPDLYPDKEAFLIMAVLHDVIEDTPKEDAYAEERLKGFIKAKFGEIVLSYLVILTRDRSQTQLEYYIQYIHKIIGMGNKNLMLIKMADLEHNLDIKRQKRMDDKDLARIQKYHIAYRMLRTAIGE